MVRMPEPLVSAQLISCSTAAMAGLRMRDPGVPRLAMSFNEKPGFRISIRLL